MAEELVVVDRVSKKFCRDLKRSLWYGVKDIASELVGSKSDRDQLRKDEFWAVKDVSFTLKRGECLGLIGHNGAGKSTLLKMLNGLIKPDQGTITMKGRIGALIELGAGFNPVLTGRENVYINGQVLGLTKKEIDSKFDAIVDFAEIGEFIDTPVQNYSSGMKVRLGFAVAAQLEPDVLIIDEVLAVGDVGFRAKCFNKIQNLLTRCAIIFVSHQMAQIGRLSSVLLVMRHGAIGYYGMDIPFGVESYNKIFDSKSAKFKIGDGRVEVTEIIINGQSIDNGISITHNDYFHLSFKIDYLTQLAGISVWFAFTNADSQSVAQNYSQLLNFTKFELLLECKLDKILLSPGSYGLSIRVLEGEYSSILFGCDFPNSINVVGERMSSAPVIFHGAWSVK